MFKRIVLSFILIFSNGLSAQAPFKVIAVEYPPFLSTKMTNLGTSYHLLNQYAETHFKSDFEAIFVPPGRAQQMIRQGDWCMSFYPPAADNIKAKFVRLSEDNVKLGLYRLSQGTEFNYASLSELKGSVAILRKNYLDAIQSRLNDAGLELVHLETIEQGIQMLMAGRVDYAFGDNTTVDNYTHIENIDKLQFSKTPLVEYPVGFFYNTDCASALYKSVP